MTAQAPWYTYPMDAPGGGYGFTEPQCPGCYKKPDTNIAVPAGTDITSLLAGTITSVKDLGWNAGGLSVTEKLVNPLNSEAQYVSYNFLGSAEAYQGENVVPGTLIGKAGSPYGVLTAVGLGEDPVWGQGKFLSGTGDPLLNPEVQLLDKIRAGIAIPTATLGYTSNPASSNILQQIGTDLARLADPNFWARTGVIVLGGVLVLVGAWKLMK